MSAEIVGSPHRYMHLTRHEVDATKLPLDESKQELESYIENDDPSENPTHGYFPEYCFGSDYPESTSLAGAFTKGVINNDPALENMRVSLAFVRRATAEPTSGYGGMHIDVSKGVGHKWDGAIVPTAHVLRLLYNLDSVPRRLDFSKITRNVLVEEKGLDIPRYEYKIISGIGKAAMRSIEIPPIEQDAVYGLRFVSSILPHSGVTDEKGHFMIAYGAYVDGQQIESLFQGTQ